jgi:hypothetical protein
MRAYESEPKSYLYEPFHGTWVWGVNTERISSGRQVDCRLFDETCLQHEIAKGLVRMKSVWKALTSSDESKIRLDRQTCTSLRRLCGPREEGSALKMHNKEHNRAPFGTVYFNLKVSSDIRCCLQRYPMLLAAFQQPVCPCLCFLWYLDFW